MQLIYVKNLSSRLDELKYVYAFMKNQQTLMKECSIRSLGSEGSLNMPMLDLYNESMLPEWDILKNVYTNVDHKLHFNCISSITTSNSVRLVMQIINNQVLISIHGKNISSEITNEWIELHVNAVITEIEKYLLKLE